MGRSSDKRPNRSDRSNIMGKFTQSVKRLVQEVKEEGVPADGETRDDAINTNQLLRGVKTRLSENYDTARTALLTLHSQYTRSKSNYNTFTRYKQLKAMVKEVVRLETEYWQLMEVPRQEKQEPIVNYVLRACTIVEKTHKTTHESNDKVRKTTEEDERKRINAERLNGMTTSQIFEENTQLINDLYRLLRKYSSLRTLMRELKEDYSETKIYPMIPRYFFLKNMIKQVMRDSAFVELCHEAISGSLPPPHGGEQN